MSAASAGNPDGVRDAPPLPPYADATLADLVPSILAALGVPAAHNVLALPPQLRCCLMLIDGLGWRLLREAPEAAPFLNRLAEVGRPISAPFPSTTATSLVSVGTGLPPARHGVVGYKMAIPGSDRVLNALRWDSAVDPLAWQPHRTAFERAVADGVSVVQVGPRKFRGSGLTLAGLRGACYAPAETPGDVIATAAAAAAGDADRSLVYAYHGDLDKTGHLRGCRSDAWRYQLALVDRQVEKLAGALASDVLLLVTADHGMVDVPVESRVDVDEMPALLDGVALMAGEGRARYLHAVPGAVDDVLATWLELLGDRMWVVAREEAASQGWFGPIAELPAPAVLDRIGDVVAAARTDVSVVASLAEPMESSLVGHHGSLTADEQLVPLLASAGGQPIALRSAGSGSGP